MARQGHRGVAEMLLQINPKCMDATNASGDTCLHYATISEVNAVFFFLNAVCVCVCVRARARTHGRMHVTDARRAAGHRVSRR